MKRPSHILMATVLTVAAGLTPSAHAETKQDVQKQTIERTESDPRLPYLYGLGGLAVLGGLALVLTGQINPGHVDAKRMDLGIDG